MSPVILEPRDLRQFSAFLADLSVSLSHAESKCTAELQSLRSVWRDEKLSEFEQKYQRTADEVTRFCLVCEHYAAHLDEKAKRAERYLGG